MNEEHQTTHSYASRKVLETPRSPGPPLRVPLEAVARRIPTRYADGRWETRHRTPGNAIYHFENPNVEILIETVDGEHHSDPKVYIDVIARIPRSVDASWAEEARTAADDIANRLVHLYRKALDSRDRISAAERQDRQAP